MSFLLRLGKIYKWKLIFCSNKHFLRDNVSVPQIYFENVKVRKEAERLASGTEDGIDRQSTDSSTLNCKD